MTRLTLVLASLMVLAAFPALAEPPATLAGVHSVYLNVSNLSARRDIAQALKRELPEVQVVTRSRDADAVIEFRGTGASEGSVETREVSTSNVVHSKTGATETVPAPIGQATHNPGHLRSFLVRGTAETLLLEGLWTPAFPTQTAARFIRAWRVANRP